MIVSTPALDVVCEVGEGEGLAVVFEVVAGVIEVVEGVDVAAALVVTALD